MIVKNCIQLNTDCEGPCCLNDNAFELCKDFLKPNGDRFFRQISRYDDYMAEMFKKQGYKAGDTLKLILPFLKAYDLTNKKILDYSIETVRLVSGVEETYRFLRSLKFPIFEISTSYSQFALAVGAKLGIDKDHIFSTELDLDRYKITTAEVNALKKLKSEIIGLPEIELPETVQTFNDLNQKTKNTITRLDQIFWKIIPRMKIGIMYQEINPIGGSEKVRAMHQSLIQTGLPLSNVIYIGDSITDVQAFKEVRAGGGLAVSFNGNCHAVKNAEFIVIANSAWPIVVISTVFILRGKAGVLELAHQGLPPALDTLGLPLEWTNVISAGLEGRQTEIYLAGAEKHNEIVAKSFEMCSNLRGKAIAALG